MATTTLEYYGTGKRKTSIARVHLRPGKGEFQLNDRGLDEYFGGIEALKTGLEKHFGSIDLAIIARRRGGEQARRGHA